MVNIAVLVSGGGTNLQALIDNQHMFSNGKLSCVISSNPTAFALTRARDAGIDRFVCSRKEFEDMGCYEKTVDDILKSYDVELIVLAGFMTILSNNFCKAYKNKIINVHPSLIPSFCGDGFYGLKVHKAALERGVKITGATVHFVNEIPDGGDIISQKAVEVMEDDTPESLQKRVMVQAEQVLLPNAVKWFCDKELLK